MGYKFDVFLSYTTAFPFGDWVHEHFKGFFEAYLTNELNRPAKVFIDRDEISAGEAWPERLKRALADSRCLVAVWSPSYFRSPWCIEECAVMLYREHKLKYRTTDNPTGLILPVIVHDGNHFPDFAKRVQCLDCKKFARIGQGFKNSMRYIQFQDYLIPWTKQVARAVEHAPPWKVEWRSKEWISTAIATFPTISDSGFELPILE